jgi:glycerol uptake facilitator-like aquaporin
MLHPEEYGDSASTSAATTARRADGDFVGFVTSNNAREDERDEQIVWRSVFAELIGTFRSSVVPHPSAHSHSTTIHRFKRTLRSFANLFSPHALLKNSFDNAGMFFVTFFTLAGVYGSGVVAFDAVSTARVCVIALCYALSVGVCMYALSFPARRAATTAAPSTKHGGRNGGGAARDVAKARAAAVTAKLGRAATTISTLAAGDASPSNAKNIRHLNPAVTLALFFMRRVTRRRLLLYWTAQFGGALIAVLAVLVALPQQRFQPWRPLPHTTTTQTALMLLIGDATLLLLILLTQFRHLTLTPTALSLARAAARRRAAQRRDADDDGNNNNNSKSKSKSRVGHNGKKKKNGHSPHLTARDLDMGVAGDGDDSDDVDTDDDDDGSSGSDDDDDADARRLLRHYRRTQRRVGGAVVGVDESSPQSTHEASCMLAIAIVFVATAAAAPLTNAFGNPAVAVASRLLAATHTHVYAAAPGVTAAAELWWLHLLSPLVGALIATAIGRSCGFRMRRDDTETVAAPSERHVGWSRGA